jgi:hypothetical protein
MNRAENSWWGAVFAVLAVSACSGQGSDAKAFVVNADAAADGELPDGSPVDAGHEGSADVSQGDGPSDAQPGQDGALDVAADGLDSEAETGPIACVDVCRAGAQSAQGTCTLWDDGAKAWLTGIEDGDGHLHNRARHYTSLLRERMMPAGGVFRTLFTDDTYTQASMYAGRRDSPIWTGTYLAAEAMRLMVTGAPDAAQQVAETVGVLDRWWRISGDRGYLSRFAAPADSAQPVLDILAANDPENHLNVQFEGKLWHWKGDVSRDQYQGVMLGFSYAYEATQDEAVKEIIRADVVSFVEQLMEKKTRPVNLVINSVPVTVQMELQYAVFTDDETPNGAPRIAVNTSPFEETDEGFLNFWPNPSVYLRQVQALAWLPDIYLRSQAIQLASMFKVALQVTDGVPGYEARRAAILQHYDATFDEWLNIADGWTNTNNCGDAYHGLNIAFEPMLNWVRLEQDPVRKAHLQNNVLRDRMWLSVANHKNVFFAYIHASQASSSTNTAAVISSHNAQLEQFPPAPYTAIPVDNTPKYSVDPNCSGLASEAIDVGDRVPWAFLWERNPWLLTDPGEPHFVYPGVDYLIAYWMARTYGFMADDAPGTCLRWKQ